MQEQMLLRGLPMPQPMAVQQLQTLVPEEVTSQLPTGQLPGMPLPMQVAAGQRMLLQTPRAVLAMTKPVQRLVQTPRNLLRTRKLLNLLLLLLNLREKGKNQWQKRNKHLRLLKNTEVKRRGRMHHVGVKGGRKHRLANRLLEAGHFINRIDHAGVRQVAGNHQMGLDHQSFATEGGDSIMISYILVW